VAGEAGMMQLAPGLVRIPDVSFISWDRFPDRKLPRDPVPHLAPDLAVEVLSQSNTPKEMDRKRRDYFNAGCKLVWITDPETRTVTATLPSTNPKKSPKTAPSTAAMSCLDFHFQCASGSSGRGSRERMTMTKYPRVNDEGR
jgi:Uma2 family endonuclease